MLPDITNEGYVNETPRGADHPDSAGKSRGLTPTSHREIDDKAVDLTSGIPRWVRVRRGSGGFLVSPTIASTTRLHTERAGPVSFASFAKLIKQM
jgi:hypothetical protein